MKPTFEMMSLSHSIQFPKDMLNAVMAYYRHGPTIDGVRYIAYTFTPPTLGSKEGHLAMTIFLRVGFEDGDKSRQTLETSIDKLTQAATSVCLHSVNTVPTAHEFRSAFLDLLLELD